MARNSSSRRGAGYRCTVLELAFPWALLALPLPLLVWWLVPPHREQVSALRIPFFAETVEALGIQAQSGAMVIQLQSNADDVIAFTCDLGDFTGTGAARYQKELAACG